MKSVSSLLLLGAMVLATAPLFAQADVIVGDLTGPQTYNTIVGGKRAYAIGTTSCNIGTVPLLWVASTPAHPVIGQNIYRVKDGMFEQIGFSWLKHGFTALQGTVCSSCTANPNGTALGVGCSDPYGAGLNGQQNGLGPRYQVNPTTGVFPYPYANPPIGDSVSRRIQVDVSDVDPAQNPGAIYIGEGQYVSADDAQAGNGGNNASYRIMTFGANGAGASWNGPTVRQLPAIMAWPAIDPAVQVVEHVDNGEHYFVGYNAVPAAGGLTKHIYAVHNLNGDRAVGSFSIALQNGATAQNLTFHGISHHSGSLWADSTPWSGTVTSNGISFDSPASFQTNPNGRAIRWGQTFTFTFETAATPGDVTVGFFKTNGSFTLPGFVVPTPQWQVNTSDASFTFNGATNNTYTGPIELTVTPAEAMTMTVGSVLAGNTYDIIVQAGSGVAVNEGGRDFPGAIVNIDLSAPFMTTQGNFTSTLPGGSTNYSVGAPIPNGTTCAQMVVVDATAPVGFQTSALTAVTVDGCYAATINHTLGDDDGVEVTVGSGGDHSCVPSITHFGTVYSSLWINSNGSISFGGMDADFSPTASEFESGIPKVALGWTDLDPSAGGSITSSSLATGALSVTFNGVPAKNGGSALSGTVRFSSAALLQISGYALAGHNQDTLVGVTPGGGATGTSVVYGSIAGALSVPLNDAVYEFVSGGAPTGYTSINFIRTASAAFVTSL